MKYSEFKRWLKKQGVEFGSQKGSHIKVYLNGKMSIFPNHGAKEIPNPTMKKIKKDLDLINK